MKLHSCIVDIPGPKAANNTLMDDEETVALKNETADSKRMQLEERHATIAEWKEMLEAVGILYSQLDTAHLRPSDVEDIHKEIDSIKSHRARLAKKLGIVEK